MAEVGTFSAAVDDVARDTGRFDVKPRIVTFLRATMREVQIKARFMKDMTEDQIVATSDPYTWTFPPELRRILHVEYPMILDCRNGKIVPDYIPPSKKLSKSTNPYYFYNGPTYWIFAGMGGIGGAGGGLINLAYLSYFSNLAYFPNVEDRPATFSSETQTWSYKDAVTEEEQEAARALVTNWLLFNWYHVCLEGTNAKLFKNYKDERGTSTFAQYKSYQNDVLAGEAAVIITEG